MSSPARSGRASASPVTPPSKTGGGRQVVPVAHAKREAPQSIGCVMLGQSSWQVAAPLHKSWQPPLGQVAWQSLFPVQLATLPAPNVSMQSVVPAQDTIEALPVVSIHPLCPSHVAV